MLIAADEVADEGLAVLDMSAVDAFAPLEQLLEFEPGPAIISFLNSLDLNELDGPARVVVMELWERQQAWLAERAVTATAAVCGPTPKPGEPIPWDGGDDWNRELVAASLGLTDGGARTRVEVARRLTEDLPLCRASMAAGTMSYRHACVLVEAIAELDGPAAAAVDVRVASRIAGQSWDGFRRTLRAAVLAAAPDLAEAAHEIAVRHRDVQRLHGHDGMGRIEASMSAVDAQTVWLGLDATAQVLQAAARAAGEVDLGIGAYRSDALVEWAKAALASPDAPSNHGRRAQVQIVMDVPSLLGLAENPAELVGYGPITASVARKVALDADWRRLVVEPVTGCLLDYGSVIYRPPQALADFIVARDRRCRFPGCTRRGERCDIDHCDPAPDGSTSSKNCCCLCRRHHRLKTHGGWKLQLHLDGSCMWTAPNGRRFRVAATRQLE